MKKGLLLVGVLSLGVIYIYNVRRKNKQIIKIKKKKKKKKRKLKKLLPKVLLKLKSKANLKRLLEI